jgi:hypothetical protein
VAPLPEISGLRFGFLGWGQPVSARLPDSRHHEIPFCIVEYVE